MAKNSQSKKTKRVTTFENLDKISDLPQEVTDEILKRIPIEDAVQTSILSTKWRYRWTSIPELVFDGHSMEADQEDEDLGKVVNNVLLLHNAAISKFILKKFLEKGCSDVDRWIVVLSRSKKLYHLVLAFKEIKSYKLPACLFSCETLITLRLECCILRLPSQYKGFSHLTELELNRVNLESGTFENLVAKIPLLKKLEVLYCSSLTRIRVHAPNLKVVRVRGLYESINFQNTPTLISIDLSLPKVTSWVDQVHGRLHERQTVDVNFPNTESFPIDDAPGDCTPLITISNVQIFCSNLKIHPRFWRFFPCTYADGESVQLYEEHFWDKRLYTEDVFHHLKTVRLHGFMGVQHELQFIQFILLNAVVLETFDIFWRHGIPAITDNKKLHIVQKMMQCRRAS